MRVDIRGSGDSDGHQGVFAMRQEQDDTLQVLKWIAAAPLISTVSNARSMR